MITLRRLAAIVAVPIAVGACHDSGPTTPPRLGTCSPSARVAFERLASVGTSASVGTLVPLQGATASAAELPSCLQLLSDGGTYLIVPQFPTDSASFAGIDFSIGSQQGVSALTAAPAMTAGAGLSPQLRLDNALRRAEHRLALRAASSGYPISANVVAAQNTQPDSLRTFQVLSSIRDTTGNSFDTVVARLHFTGTNIYIYVDTMAPQNGFDSTQLKAFGDLFDQELYGIDTTHFGSPSDIDGNGHIIVLLSPTVNALTDSATCKNFGFVAGFFNALDLVPQMAHSNDAEIFYAIVPDQNGEFSCSHPVSQVERITPATFIHEFQHMISFNQHVIVRHGPDEVPWLNEGLSHIAESLGADYFNAKYPPPPTQAFPYADSAIDFIQGDLFNSYSYLHDPTLHTDTATSWAAVLNWSGDGTLEERGGAWLFLRWLGDQKGQAIYRSLEQTALTGVANVQAQASESFPSLFGDFGMAVYTDSLPGIPRSQIADRLKFVGDPPFRQTFAALFDLVHGPTTELPQPFPITLTPIPAGSSVQATMPPGTLSLFSTQTAQSGSPLQLFFTAPNGTALGSNLHAQVSVFRCPSAAACP